MQRERANEIQEETFSAAETPDDDAKCRAALLDALQVLEQRRHFVFAPDLEQMQTETRDKARLQGLENGVALASFDFAHDCLGRMETFTATGSSPSSRKSPSCSSAHSLSASKTPSGINLNSAASC